MSVAPKLPGEIAAALTEPKAYGEWTGLQDKFAWARQHAPLAVAEAPGFDPFWAVKYGGESERERGNAMLTQAMSTVLANHGIDPDSLLDSDQNGVRQLDWDGLLDNQLALAS